MTLAVILSVLLICIRSLYSISPSGTDQLFISGDVYIGALVSVHDLRKDDGSCGNRCCRLSADQVIQTEVMRLSIDHINRHLLNDSGYQLGLKVVDDGNNPDFGMQQAVSLMNDQQDSIDRTGSFDKETWGRKERPLGIISTSLAEVVERADELFRSFLMSTIGTANMNVEEFSDGHPYLLSTSASDAFLAKAVSDLALKLKWYQFAVIYDSSNYGQRMYRSFSEIFESGNGKETGSLCHPYFFEFDGRSESLVEITERLLNESIMVVVTAMKQQNAKVFFLRINTATLNKNLQWVDINDWNMYDYSDELMDDTLKNAIKIDLIRPDLPILKDFLLNLTYEQVLESKNPWLIELVTCDYCSETQSISTSDSHGRIKSSTKLQQQYCNNDTKIELKHIERGVDRSFMIYEALVSYAMAFESIRKTSCANSGSLCDGFFADARGRKLIEQLQNVTIDHDDQLARSFSYLDRNGPPFYSIVQYQHISDVRGKSAYQWLTVGQWHFGLDLNTVCKTSTNNGKELANGCLINGLKYELQNCTINKSDEESTERKSLGLFSFFIMLPSSNGLVLLVFFLCCGKRSRKSANIGWLTLASFVPISFSMIPVCYPIFDPRSPRALAFFKIPLAAFWLTMIAVALVVDSVRVSYYAVDRNKRVKLWKLCSLLILFCSLLLVQILATRAYYATRLSNLDLTDQTPSIISEELLVLFTYPALLFFCLIFGLNQSGCSNVDWVTRKRKCYHVGSLFILTISVIFYVIYAATWQRQTIIGMDYTIDTWLTICIFFYAGPVLIGLSDEDNKRSPKCDPDLRQIKSDLQQAKYRISSVNLLTPLNNHSLSLIVLPRLNSSSEAKNGNTPKHKSDETLNVHL